MNGLLKNITNLERKLIFAYCLKNSCNSKYIINNEIISIDVVYDAIKDTKKYKIFFMYIRCALQFIKLYKKIKVNKKK